MSTVKMPRAVLAQLYHMTIGSEDIKIVKYGKEIKDLVEKANAFLPEVEVNQKRIEEIYPTVCSAAQNLLKEYLPKEEYFTFPNIVDRKVSNNIFIGDGFAPINLENKCLLIDKSKYPNKPTVEVTDNNRVDGFWVIAIKVKR
jgi:hypothetical protein